MKKPEAVDHGIRVGDTVLVRCEVTRLPDKDETQVVTFRFPWFGPISVETAALETDDFIPEPREK